MTLPSNPPATTTPAALKTWAQNVVDTLNDIIAGNIAFTGDIVVPDEAYDATSWNGSLEVPTKNAVRDKVEGLLGGFTATGDIVVPDEAYDATAWNGSLEVPTKNAVRDKVESILAAGLSQTNNTWTPTVASGTGTLTSAAGTGRYTLIGDDLVFFNLDVTITTNGTGATSISATMPFAALTGHTYLFVGREDATAGFILQGKLAGASSTMSIFKQDNSYPGGTGNILRLSGWYRKAP